MYELKCDNDSEDATFHKGLRKTLEGYDNSLFDTNVSEKPRITIGEGIVEDLVKKTKSTQIMKSVGE
ncbi:MAG: hypothetical protein GY804_03200 [Alphaproteobacteria bacterium]|nr:hypothetical protein [Alphaproteobacteria bacterium]